MHLLQDSANPSHVRNDDHISLSGVGDVDGLHDYMARQSVSSYPGATFFTPDSSLLETEGAVRSEPFSNLFDTNTYQGGNPGATLGTDVGIAEFANANFFSDDTIPGQSTLLLFPFPDVFELVPGPSNLPYLTLPRLGSSTFPAARAAKLTSNQAAAQFLLTNTNFDLIGKLELDDAVYDAQAQNLIPRAIDYSAAVLDYFFRGDIEVNDTKTKFQLTGLVQPGGVCAPIPTMSTGVLDVVVTIPSNLNFGGTASTASLYYEQSDGTRVFAGEFPNPPSGEEILGGPTILLSEIADPVRFYVVLDGDSGPGTQETRAIVAKTGLAAWEFVCVI
jgi:hypothetical protein